MIDLYPWFALLSSIAFTILFGGYVLTARRNRLHFHDDRSAVEYLVSLSLFVISIGLLVSASASFLFAGDFILRQEVRNLGLGLVRGVMLTLASVLFLAHPQRRWRFRLPSLFGRR